MGTKAERRAASERVAAYHEARLGELIEHITAAIDGYRAGEIDAYTVDATIHHYHRAARELKTAISTVRQWRRDSAAKRLALTA